MPKRSNLFQDVVARLHRHLALQGDQVTESGMLRHAKTGAMREVDVVIHSEVAGQEVTVCVEATDTGRPASIEWVERLIGKHAELPTNKLVLVSSGGFTANARVLAEKSGASAIAPEDLQGGDPTYAIVNNVASVKTRVLEFTPEVVSLLLMHDEKGPIWLRDLPFDTLVLTERLPFDTLPLTDDSHAVFPLERLVWKGLVAKAPQWATSATFAQENVDAGGFNFTWQPVYLWVEHFKTNLCIRRRRADSTIVLDKVLALRTHGTARNAILDVPLRHLRVGDVVTSFGEFEAHGERMAFIGTARHTDEKLVVRLPHRHDQAATDVVLTIDPDDGSGASTATFVRR